MRILVQLLYDKRHYAKVTENKIECEDEDVRKKPSILKQEGAKGMERGWWNRCTDRWT